MGKRIRVLIVDDSAVVRQTLQEILESDQRIEVMATAQDPIVAAEKISKQVPDVITLDIEMPRMDGITFLQKIMSQHPIPIVICSSLTTKGSQTAIKALEYGAVEIITKPRMGAKKFLEDKGAKVKTISLFARDFSEVEPDYLISGGLTYEITFPWERIKDKKLE